MDSIVQLPLSLIDEDPNQPRTEFNEESLRELAETIKERGVKTPISVRLHPEISGRYIINHGARRFRASRMAGKETIPACVDDDYTEEDQLVENLQREDLSALEIAEFMARLRKKGRKKTEIAKAIGKSPSYVTHHLLLLELPEPLEQAFRGGRCSDVTGINDLNRLFRVYPEQVRAWLADETQEINRTSINVLKGFLDTLPPASFDQVAAVAHTDARVLAPKESSYLKRPTLLVEIEGQRARMLLNRRPGTEDRAWFQSESGQLFEAPLSSVRLIALYSLADGNE